MVKGPSQRLGMVVALDMIGLRWVRVWITEYFVENPLIFEVFLDGVPFVLGTGWGGFDGDFVLGFEDTDCFSEVFGTKEDDHGVEGVGSSSSPMIRLSSAALAVATFRSWAKSLSS